MAAQVEAGRQVLQEIASHKKQVEKYEHYQKINRIVFYVLLALSAVISFSLISGALAPFFLVGIAVCFIGNQMIQRLFDEKIRKSEKAIKALRRGS